MGTSFPDKFLLPLDFNPAQLCAGRTEKVVVISIVGKGKLSDHHYKASLFNQVIDSDVFVGPIHDGNSNHERGASPCRIEGYYDEVEHIIYLNLQSMYDACTMVKLCSHADQVISSQGSSSFWQNAEHMHARALLFLFAVSHVLVLVHPGSSFDVTYVRFFRILDIIRQKLLPTLSDLLHGLPVSRDWVMSGRPCSPRVLFVFDTCTIDAEPDSVVLSKTRSQKIPPIKRLQHAIEDQVYRILRKARIITNISNNSLFAVPANQEFVYVNPYPNGTSDLVGFYMDQLRSNCIAAQNSERPLSRGYQTNRRTNSNHSNGARGDGQTTLHSVQSYQAQANTFKEFLWQHVELARTKGFDDNVGRNPQPAVFELPTVHDWLEVCSSVYDFFLVDHMDTKTRPYFNTLKSLLEVDIRFSEGRCAKVLPIAEGAYQEGLPQHYTKSYHLTKLLAAKRVFQQHARGQAAEKYLGQLEDGCEKLWRAGRRLCEEVSLTANHCVNPLHVISDGFETDETRHLPMMPHASQVKTKAACNCGRKQADRDDPFDHKAANYDFYERLMAGCCGKLEAYPLPVFEPSTTAEVKAAVTPQLVRTPSESSSCAGLSTTNTPSRVASGVRKDSSRLEMVPGMSNLSLVLSLEQSSKGSNRSHDSDMSDQSQANESDSGQSGVSDLFVTEAHSASFNPDAEPLSPHPSQDQQPAVALETVTSSNEASSVAVLVRQHSTTEYLPGMLHNNSPPGLLPKFNSWSLLSLGKYSSYSPTQGLEQPGFLHSSNFLLPYDILVTSDRSDKWPVLGDTKKGKTRKIHKDSGDTTVRIYLGNEYECPRGHRFFLSNPDKILKAPAGGMVKENAHKLLASDMPLYFPCHCRSSKGFMAQLMRVYVGVPEAPVSVYIKPLVQPGPPPCPLFHPVDTSPIQLPNGHLWVLRFPHIYMGDQGPYRMPPDQQHLAACRVPRGFYHIVDAPPTSSGT